jgi:hypothetical protein
MRPKIVVLLITLISIVDTSQAEQQKSLAVRLQDGTEVNTATNSLQKITFSDNNMVLNKIDGTTTSFPVSTIKKLYFSTVNINSISSPENNSVYIYPNPASDFIYIKNITEVGANISIYGIDGTIALKTTIISDNQQVDVSDLANGIYLLKVNSQAFKFTKK